jgi:radical SAM protein with 4Fe4S-binding SPASM domain
VFILVLKLLKVFFSNIHDRLFVFISKQRVFEYFLILRTYFLDLFNYKNVFNEINSQIEMGIQLPKSIEIETINRCNGLCSFCPINKNLDERDLTIMDENLFKKILSQLKEINYSGNIGLYSNNEPFLDKRIVRFIKMAKEALPNAYHFLFTNGTILTLENFVDVMDYLDLLIIDNYNDDLEMIAPVKKIYDYCLEHNEYQKKVEIDLRLQNQILFSRGGEAKNRKRFNRMKSSCVTPFNQMVIRPSGEVSLCCNDALGKMTLGNLNNESFLDVWYGEKYTKIREKFHQQKYARENLELCKNCDGAPLTSDNLFSFPEKEDIVKKWK